MNRNILSVPRTSNQVCIFGAGNIGMGSGYDILKTMKKTVLFFCDNDERKWGETIVDDLVCYPPEKISQYPDITVCIMVLNKDAQSDIRIQLQEYGVESFVDYDELLYCDEYIKCFFDLEEQKKSIIMDEKTAPSFCGTRVKNPASKKMAIYTCITGGYDLLEKPEVIEDGLADYYIISDDISMKNSFYSFLPVSDIVPPMVDDPIRKNRFCKILGCEIFDEYPYSIYIDGKLQITGEICHYTDDLKTGGIAIRKEEEPFDCLYKEGLWAAKTFDDTETITKQMKKYFYHGMPFHWGAYECSCLIRDNRNVRLRKAMKDWWNEVYNYSFRDQNSFTYALWKNGFSKDDILCMKGTLNNDEDLRVIKTHR